MSCRVDPPPRSRALLRFALCLALLPFEFAAALELADDRGITVRVSDRPSLAALSPHLAEIVYAAGAGARLKAVVRFSDYPEAATRLPQVGDASRLDIERILAIRPDLLLGWKSGNPGADLERLQRLGLAVFVTEPRRLGDIARLLRTVGALAGTAPEAEAAAAAYERDLEALRARYAQRASVRVFYQIWDRPLLTVNGQHMISDVIALCGGRNVFAQASVLTPAVSLEAVLAARPDVVLGGSSARTPGEVELSWSASRVRALRDLPVRYIPPDLIQRQTPRIAQGARIICEHLEEVRRMRK